MIIMNYNIKILGMGYQDKYQSNVIICDMCDNVIFNGCTYNGMINLCLNKGELYKIKANSYRGNFNKVFIAGDNSNIYLSYNVCMNNVRNSNLSTFILTDENYEGLPIMEGEIILSQQ